MRLVLLLALVLTGSAGAQNLGLLDRFGPDGLPFTHDDPLVVGASGHEHRYGAMGGDACSEEPPGTFPAGQGAVPGKPPPTSAHGSNGHPNSSLVGTRSKMDQHKPSPDPGNPNLPGDMPLDLMVFMSAINPRNGLLSRFRLFPDDDKWLPPEQAHTDRGWGNDPGWKPDEDGLDEIWSGSGSADRPKNLHLDTMGLAYRDVKEQEGYALGIKTSTFENVLVIPEGSAKDLLGTQVDMTVQQSYIEAWVMELMNLDNLESAISGNFVADLAGLQLNIKLPAIKKSIGVPITGPTCEFDLSEIPIRLGDPVKADKSWEDITPTDYFIEDRMGMTLKKVKATGALGLCQSAIDVAAGASTSSNPAIRWLANWLAKTFLLMDDKFKRIFGKLDSYAAHLKGPDFQKIGDVSGLAGYESSSKNFKTPIDRIALATFERKGNFKPTEWNYWRKVEAPPSGFEAESNEKLKQFLNQGKDFIDSGQRFEEGQKNDKWRYNNGGTIVTKSMMLYGNSAGTNAQPGTYDSEQNIMSPWPDANTAHKSRDQLPDILEHFARWWTYIRLDAIDPYKLEEKEHAALWISRDLLIDKPPVDADFKLDWPPPNFHFGRAQVTAFRAGSGGKLAPAGNPAGAPKFHVDPSAGTHFHGLISVDPVGKTYTISGTMIRGTPGGGSSAGDLGDSPRSHDFGWTPLLPIPDGVDDEDDMKNGTPLRWLQAFANRHYGADAEFQFLWDFENDRQLDSDHAQHLSHVGDPAFNGAGLGSVFVIQTTAGGQPTGRTGFALAPMNPEARDALKQLAE